MRSGLSVLEALREEVLVGDGAIGTELFARGAAPDEGVERVNITDPQSVLRLHEDYVAAGSQVIETNTFGANRPNLSRYADEDRVREIILAGVSLARRAAGDKAYVAGSIGPLPIQDGESADQAERLGFFKEHIELLIEGGVDLLMFESFADLDELTAAVSLARSLTDLPIAAQMAFGRGGFTDQGVRAMEVGERCREAGADIVGANCGYGAAAVVEALRQMMPLDLPTSGYMNAGFPEKVERRLVYQSSPEYLVSRAKDLVKLGTRIIGGCCGVGPETIRLISQSVGRETRTRVSISSQPRLQEHVSPPVSDTQTPELPGKVLVEIDPPASLDVEPALEAARDLAKLPVSAITVADNPLAASRLDHLTFASLVQKTSGLPVVLHLNGRDRNRIALQSTIMGAHVLGIRSILCITGDPVRMCQEPNTSGVFDLSSIALVRMVNDYNLGRLRGGDCRTLFSIGVAFNPNVSSMSGQISRLERKIEAGAHFVLTQPVFDAERLDAMLEALADAEIHTPIYLGVLPLMSLRNADFLHSEVPGIVVPDAVRKRLSRHDDVKDQRKVGAEVAVEVVKSAAGRVHGFYMIAPRNRVDVIAPAIQEISLCLP